MAILLDMIIDGLPDISALEDQLADIVAANVDIKAKADMNSDMLNTLTDNITDGNAEIVAAADAITQLMMDKAMFTDAAPDGLIA